ncbi:MAG: flagellar biosynthesis regulator FlaF [Alphaproteobacteria bacterium]|nr:flagellar biosynthesis regulator FlaF [Alphaproteobacteria bacterium]MDX5369035.1 flagellar biosynthesis regulator FlaF [Alphaproteobacteria bacterium]MDX5463738.1 flagellar biosynthesis regulator FlaF [Alphaproteobacteria bacterium]
MNAALQAQAAYAAASRSTETPKGIEYQVFSRVTARIEAARRKGKPGFADMAHALHDNRMLWDAIAADVAQASNPYPAPLKAQLIYLSEFTRHQSNRILAGEADADVLIEVNTAIMKGLKGAQPVEVPA